MSEHQGVFLSVKLKYRFLMVRFTGMKHGGGKNRHIRAVRRVLRLQAEARVFFISLSALSEWRRVVLNKISGV